MEAKDRVTEAGHEAKDRVTEAGHEAKDRANEAGHEMKDRAVQASREARGRITGLVDERSTDAGQQVVTTADALRQTSSQLRDNGSEGPARLIDSLAARIEDVGRWLRDSDSDQLLRDVEGLGRRQPTPIMLGGLAVGFALSRLLGASSSRRQETVSSSDSVRAAGGPGPAGLSGSPTSGLAAEGTPSSAPTSRMGTAAGAPPRERTGGTAPPDPTSTGGV